MTLPDRTLRPDGAPRALRFSGDGARLFAQLGERTVAYDPASGEIRSTFAGQLRDLDGDRLLLGVGDRLRCVSARSGAEHWSCKRPHRHARLLGARLLSVRGDRLQLGHPRSPHPPLELAEGSGLVGVAGGLSVSPAGRWAVTWGYGLSVLRLWDLQEIGAAGDIWGSAGTPTAAAFLDEDTLLSVASGVLYRWSVPDGRLLSTTPLPGYSADRIEITDNRYVAVSYEEEDRVDVIDLEAPPTDPAAEEPALHRRVTARAPGGVFLASARSSWDEDDIIEIWQRGTPTPSPRPAPPTPDRLVHALGRWGSVDSVAVSPDGRLFAWGTVAGHDFEQGGGLQVWDVAAGAPLYVVEHIYGGLGGVRSERAPNLQWRPDSEQLGVMYAMNCVGLYSVRASQTEMAQQLYYADGWPHGPAWCWSPDGRKLAFGTWPSEYHQGTTSSFPLIIADADGGPDRCFDIEPPHPQEDWLASVAWCPDGDTLVLRTGSGHLYRFSLREEAVTFSMVWSGTLSPDGRWLASCHASGVRLLDVMADGAERSVSAPEPSWLSWIWGGRGLMLHCAERVLIVDPHSGARLLTVAGGLSVLPGARTRRVALYADGQITVVSLETGRAETEQTLSVPGTPLAFAGPDEGTLIIESDDALTFWDLSAGCARASAPRPQTETDDHNAFGHPLRFPGGSAVGLFAQDPGVRLGGDRWGLVCSGAVVGPPSLLGAVGLVDASGQCRAARGAAIACHETLLDALDAGGLPPLPARLRAWWRTPPVAPDPADGFVDGADMHGNPAQIPRRSSSHYVPGPLEAVGEGGLAPWEGAAVYLSTDGVSVGRLGVLTAHDAWHMFWTYRTEPEAKLSSGGGVRDIVAVARAVYRGHPDDACEQTQWGRGKPLEGLSVEVGAALGQHPLQDPAVVREVIAHMGGTIADGGDLLLCREGAPPPEGRRALAEDAVYCWWEEHFRHR